MRRLTPIFACIVAAFPSANPLAGQEPGDSSVLAGFYHAFGFALARSGEIGEQDLIITAGRAYLAGPGGPWMVRAEGASGVSFYGSVRDAGYLLGGQLGLVRTWSGNYVTIHVRTELFAIAGAGAFMGWNLEETPDETHVIPVLSWGGGLRFRGADRRLATLAVLREHRIGAWGPRLVIRVGMHVPRGRTPQ